MSAGGVACLLQGIQGSFTTNDPKDGVLIHHDDAKSQYFIDTRSLKAGWTQCIQ